MQYSDKMARYANWKDLSGPAPEAKPRFEVTKVESAQHKNHLVRSNRVCVVDIYADWCAPCKAIADKYAELASKYSSAGECALVKEDIDDEITSSGVRGVPTFQFFLQGNLHSSITGADMGAVENRLVEILQR